MSEEQEPGLPETILEELVLVVDPVASAGKRAADGDPTALFSLLQDAGVVGPELNETVDAMRAEVESVVGAWDTIQSDLVTPLANGNLPPLGELDSVFGAFKDLFETIQGLDEFEVPEVDVDKPGERLVDYLLIKYLADNHSDVHALLCAVGVIEKDDLTAAGDLNLAALGDVVSEPNAALKDALGWAGESFEPFVVLFYVREVLTAQGVMADLEVPDSQTQAAVQDQFSSAIEDQQLNVPVLTVQDDSGVVDVGVNVVPVPASGDRLPGLAIVPYGLASASVSYDLGDDWVFDARASAEAGWALRAQPTTDGSLHTDVKAVEGDAGGEIDGEASVSYEPSGGATDEVGSVLFGEPGGTYLGLNNVAVAVSLSFDGDSLVVDVSLPASGRLNVQPQGGFLSKVLPESGFGYDFDVTVGWNSDGGLYFERGGTLEVSLPQNVDLGPLSLSEVYLAATPGEGDGPPTFPLEGALSGDVELGPLVGSVERLGIQADVAFPEDRDGNFGLLDLETSFRPPDGIGLSIDAGPVTGGGYLKFDPENDRYAGVLQLQIGSLSITAVGLLSTKLPGGRDGFSLLVIISGQFTPVQLGFGFTLNGVGGLLGINRSMKAEPLGRVVRTGSLDGVLFPADPVANAQRIISDLRAIFPPTADRHVFGPMVRLGWGTPTLLTGDLGVVLELPTGKVAILGNFAAVLPDEVAPLIEINMAVSGVIDPPGQRVAVDAALYDSRVVQWAISGQMAMRSNWGDDPRFVLAVGGFNPRFEPPEEFPSVDRVKASMGVPGGNPRLELTGYFALTSNTVQAGAGVFLLAEAGPARVKGRLAFDALLQFDPFKLVVDFLASLSVEIKGKGLSIRLDGTLSGPGPWRVQGTLHIEILFFDVTVNVDVSIGPSPDQEALPPADVMPKVVDALGTPSNWTAQLPDGESALVTVREIEADEDAVVAHPLGTVAVRQTVAPLGRTIEKFGNMRPGGHDHFGITAVRAGDEALEFSETATEQFAPAQYLEMGDSEKLDSSGFRAWAAGRKLDYGDPHCGYRGGEGRSEAAARTANTRTTTVGYETTVVDRTRDEWATPLSNLGRFDALRPAVVPVDQVHMDALAPVGAVARADVNTTGGRRFDLDAAERHHLADTAGVAGAFVGGEPENPDAGGLSESIDDSETAYTVVDAGDLSATTIATAVDRSTAKAALADHEAANPGERGRYRVVEARKAREAGERMEVSR